MSPNRPALLALLALALVVAPATHAVAVAPASGQATGPPGPGAPALSDELSSVERTVVITQPNTSNYLGIEDGDVQATGRDRTGLNVAGALERDVIGLQNEYASLTFEQRYANTTGQQARVAVLEREVDRLAERVRQLKIQRNRLLDDYSAGEVSTRTFLRELAAMDATARGIEAQFERIRGAAGLELSSELDTRMNNLEADLLTLYGPVRGQVAEAMAGDRGPLPVYVATSETGVVLASIDGARYHREAYIGANRDQVGRNKFVSDGDPSGISTANNRVTELYPWVYDNIRSGPNIETIGNTSVYYVQLGHPHGSLDVYLDGRSESAYREYQTKSLSNVPVTQTTNASEGVRLAINRTHGTGPMQVSVSDNVTGDPLNATVTVNGETVGTTGDDGSLWTITPEQAVRVRVTTREGQIVRQRFFAR